MGGRRGEAVWDDCLGAMQLGKKTTTKRGVLSSEDVKAVEAEPSGTVGQGLIGNIETSRSEGSVAERTVAEYGKVQEAKASTPDGGGNTTMDGTTGELEEESVG
jgi:hypothetical protein